MRILALAAFGALILAAAPFAGAALAQTTGPAPAAKAAKGAKAQPGTEAAKPDPAAAERAMESGIKSYEAGKNDVAAQALSTAMQGGALPGPKMARALYYRGLAYKKLGKPAQSISDLTSALWLKGGLTEAERTDALAQREASYREAGIAQAPAVTTTAAKGAAVKSTASTPATTANAPAAAPAAAAKPAETASSSSSGGFFSNLFGGSSSSSPPPAAAGAATATATGSVSSTPPEPAASSWNSASNASTGAKPTGQAAAAASAAVAPAAKPAAPAAAPTKVAAATPAAPATAPATSVADGKFRLQVAAVRSRAEADTIAARLKKDFAKKIGGRQPVIDEAVIGNMGTFYRVRVGPYASANEPRQLCITLRASGGYDCLVVTQ